jgi:hypothetical protein
MLSRRRRAATGLCGVVLAVGLASVPLDLTPVASATSASQALTLIYVDTGPSPVTSSAHRHLMLDISADVRLTTVGSTTSCSALTSVSLTNTDKSRSHAWSMTIPCTAIGVDGNGALLSVAPADIAPFGSFSLHFAPWGKPSSIVCTGGSLLAYNETATGSYLFNTQTNSHEWGSVKARTYSFGRTASLELIYGTLTGCPPPPSANSRDTALAMASGNRDIAQRSAARSTCSRTYLFSTIATPADGEVAETALAKTPVGRAVDLQVTRIMPLTVPEGARRIDIDVVRLPAMTYTVWRNYRTVVIHTNGHNATGSAVLTTSGAPVATHYHCTVKKTTHTAVSDTWSAGSFTNGSKPLMIGDMFGPISLPDTNRVTFTADDYTH